MAKFEMNDDLKKQVKDFGAKAKSLNVNIDKLASSADASFKFQDGDKVTIPCQVAQIVAMNNSANQANDDAPKGYVAFEVLVGRGSDTITTRVSARQLFTPTVAENDPQLTQHTVTINGRERSVVASETRLPQHKRFGEHGSIHLVDGVPVIDNEMKFDVELQDVLLPVFVSEQQRRELPEELQSQNLYAKREGYGICKNLF